MRSQAVPTPAGAPAAGGQGVAGGPQTTGTTVRRTGATETPAPAPLPGGARENSTQVLPAAPPIPEFANGPAPASARALASKLVKDYDANKNGVLDNADTTQGLPGETIPAHAERLEMSNHLLGGTRHIARPGPETAAVTEQQIADQLHREHGVGTTFDAARAMETFRADHKPMIDHRITELSGGQQPVQQPGQQDGPPPR